MTLLYGKIKNHEILCNIKSFIYAVPTIHTLLWSLVTQQILLIFLIDFEGKSKEKGCKRKKVAKELHRKELQKSAWRKNCRCVARKEIVAVDSTEFRYELLVLLQREYQITECFSLFGHSARHETLYAYLLWMIFNYMQLTKSLRIYLPQQTNYFSKLLPPIICFKQLSKSRLKDF